MNRIGAAIGTNISDEQVKLYSERLAKGQYLIVLEGTNDELQLAQTVEELSKHLSRQVYDIAEALKMKFANLQVSVNAIVWGQLIPMSVLSCINLINLILQV